jgi:2-iminobutanoate/2-iminopropanoate deaminase
MTNKIEINTLKAPGKIGAYSQAIAYNDLLFISGQLPINPTNNIMATDIKEQTKQCLENIKAIIQEAGGNLNDVLKCGIFIKDMDSFALINEIYASYFTEPYPARFVVEVSRLPKNALIEIDAVVKIIK